MAQEHRDGEDHRGGAQHPQGRVAHDHHDEPGAEARGGRRAPDHRVGDALDTGPLVDLEARREQRGSGHEPEVPAEPQQEQRQEQHPAAMGRGESGHQRRDREDRRPEEDDRHGPEAIGQPARDRGEGEHPQRVAREDDPHRAQVVAVIGHVERRHGHDQHHHELPDDQGDDRRGHGRAAQDGQERHLQWRARIRRVDRLPIGEVIRVRAQERERERRREADEDHRHEVRPRERRQPPLPARPEANGTICGPMTEPTVEAQTTRLIADARRASGTMSAFA